MINVQFKTATQRQKYILRECRDDNKELRAFQSLLLIIVDDNDDDDVINDNEDDGDDDD